MRISVLSGLVGALVVIEYLSATAGAIFEGDILIDESGLISFSWKSRDGYSYDLEASNDLESWHVVSTVVGTGSVVSIPVGQFDATPQSPPSGNPPETNSAHFVLRSFAGMNKTLVSWNEPESSELSNVVIDSDFGHISLPMFIGSFTDAATGLDYSLSFLFVAGPYDSSFDDYTIESLTPEEAARLAWFTDRLPEVMGAMEAAQANGTVTNGVPVVATSGAGTFTALRCSEYFKDSDGDGILDHHEKVIGTDPWLPDSDFDGYLDGQEIDAGTDPTVSSSVPGGGTGPALPADEDQDADGIPNGIDADPYDENVDWIEIGFQRMFAMPIPQSDLMTLEAVNNRGEAVMNGQSKSTDPFGAYYWKVGDDVPTALALGNLQIDAELFTHVDEDDQPVTVSVTLEIQSVAAYDINDSGKIVGEGVFEIASSGGSSGTPPGGLTVALQWSTPQSNPELVHPGKASMGAWGDMLLSSGATDINEDDVILGSADYKVDDPNAIPLTPPYYRVTRPCIWTVV